jgi:transcriptional regulator with XRE-family HTH domain
VQALFTAAPYLGFMPNGISRLRALRQAAGLSQRELARQIGERQSNVQYWEETGKAPRSDVLLSIARSLGVTVEELLGQSRTKKVLAPGGRLGRVVETISRLPRRQQDKIVEVIETFVAGQQSKAA